MLFSSSFDFAFLGCQLLLLQFSILDNLVISIAQNRPTNHMVLSDLNRVIAIILSVNSVLI